MHFCRIFFACFSLFFCIIFAFFLHFFCILPRFFAIFEKFEAQTKLPQKMQKKNEKHAICIFFAFLFAFFLKLHFCLHFFAFLFTFFLHLFCTCILWLHFLIAFFLLFFCTFSSFRFLRISSSFYLITPDRIWWSYNMEDMLFMDVFP